MTNKITLQWPHKALSPNARVHWSVKYEIGKKHKEAAFYATKAANIVLPETKRMHLFIDFFAPDKRCRDSDNLLSSCKYAIDGIASALRVNDRRFIFHPYLRDEVVKGGQVIVTITSDLNA